MRAWIYSIWAGPDYGAPWGAQSHPRASGNAPLFESPLQTYSYGGMHVLEDFFVFRDSSSSS